MTTSCCGASFNEGALAGWIMTSAQDIDGSYLKGGEARHSMVLARLELLSRGDEHIREAVRALDRLAVASERDKAKEKYAKRWGATCQQCRRSIYANGRPIATRCTRAMAASAAVEAAAAAGID